MAYYCSKCGYDIHMRETSCPNCHTHLHNVSGFAVWYDRIWYYLFLLLMAVGCVVLVIAGFRWMLSGQMLSTIPWLKATIFLIIPLLLLAIGTCIIGYFCKPSKKDTFEYTSIIIVPVLLSIVHYYLAVNMYPIEYNFFQDSFITRLLIVGVFPLIFYAIIYLFAVDKLSRRIERIGSINSIAYATKKSHKPIPTDTFISEKNESFCIECGADMEIDQERCSECGYFLFHS